MNGLMMDLVKPIVVPDRALVEELIRVPMELSHEIEFHAGLSSRARVLLDYALLGGEKEKNFEAVFYLEAGACIDVYHALEGEALQGNISARIRYYLKKHSALNVWTYVDGADLSRMEQDIFFEEEHGFASLRGLCVLSGHRESYHEVRAEHAAGHGVSRQFYKNIVADEARAGFDSLVTVAKSAAHSDSKQLNKNLILSSSARAYARPELRIHTDEVACAHGSATGQLSEEELFYLRSRGIAEPTARFMMVEGFAEEILEDISYAPMKTRLSGLAKKKIAQLTSSGAGKTCGRP